MAEKNRISVYDASLAEREKLIREINRQLEVRDKAIAELTALVVVLTARIDSAGIP